ncbi:MAG: type II toxin-antitoxin system RelE/ParE family toxin [bacterium]|nr:type II toxin-antitoxin system RelE/ParE family toxin [bacterium]
MGYEVRFAPKAVRQLRKLSKPVQRRVFEHVEALVDNPRPAGCTKLSGAEGFYRIRVGEYRVIYTIEDQKLIVLVVKIGDRKDIYRRGAGR